MTRDPELDRLKAALKAAPASSPTARAAALARAMEAYEDSALSRQGPTPPLRSGPDHPVKPGLAKGLTRLLSVFTLKPMLAATTSVAALAVGLFVVLPQGEAPPARRSAPPVAEPMTATGAEAPLARRAPEAAQGGAESVTAQGAEAAPMAAQAPMAAPAPLPGAEAPAATAPSAPEAAPLTSRSAPLGDLAPEAPLADTSAMDTAAPEGMAPSDSAAEVFANSADARVQSVAEAPVSAFPVDVDTASYARVRDSLIAGALPPPEAVRIEEMVNYFPYAYPAPEVGAPPFRPSVSVIPTPWNPETRLVHIALQGRLPEVAARPPLNLVFLIDTSDSMDDPAKLPLLRQALALLLPDLRPEDQVAIVTYAGSSGAVLAPTPASERGTILSALNRLDGGGATNGAEGLALAYRLAEGMTAKGEVSRVLLATDGDFNLGVDDPEGLAAYVARKRAAGVALSVLGFGRDTRDDATMQALAQSGNGTATSIDTLQEARKVLVDQLSGALFPIADDVKVEVEWNPSQVAEYRLIGYETRAPQGADVDSDVDAGEIGAGHAVTALYEVTAPGSPALVNTPLPSAPAQATTAETTQSTAQAPAQDTAELGVLRLRYKAPRESVSALIEAPIQAQDVPADLLPEVRFAAAIAGFGQLLRGAPDLGNWGWDQAIRLAEANRGEDTFGYRLEAVSLMRLAQSLAQQTPPAAPAP